MEDHDHLRTFIIASTAGIYSLFPLLIKPAGESPFKPLARLEADFSLLTETPIKLLTSIIWAAVVFPSLRKVVYR